METRLSAGEREKVSARRELLQGISLPSGPPKITIREVVELPPKTSG